jgi:hypothetical protein
VFNVLNDDAPEWVESQLGTAANFGKPAGNIAPRSRDARRPRLLLTSPATRGGGLPLTVEARGRTIDASGSKTS